DLAISTSSGAALNSERWTLAGLADAGEHLLAQVRSQRLTQSDRSGGLPFPQRGGRDSRDHDVFAVGRILQAIANREMHLRFGLPLQLQFSVVDTGLARDLADRK